MKSLSFTISVSACSSHTCRFWCPPPCLMGSLSVISLLNSELLRHETVARSVGLSAELLRLTDISDTQWTSNTQFLLLVPIFPPNREGEKKLRCSFPPPVDQLFTDRHLCLSNAFSSDVVFVPCDVHYGINMTSKRKWQLKEDVKQIQTYIRY